MRKHGTHRRTRNTGVDRVFGLLNTAFLIFILMAVLYPLYFVVIASVSEPLKVISGEVLLTPKGFNIKAYTNIFKNQDIMTGYKNSLMYMLIGTAVNLAGTVCAAYPLSRKDFVGRNFFMILFSLTMFFSGGLIPSYLIIKSLNLINNIWVTILPGLVTMYNVIVMRTYFQTSIPIELHESAVLDGCGNMRILRSVVLPLSKPILAVIVLFYAVDHWNAFFNALIYLPERKRWPLQMFLREILIISRGEENLQGMLDLDSTAAVNRVLQAEMLKYALIIVASFPVLVLYPFIQKHFVKGVMIGAIKG